MFSHPLKKVLLSGLLVGTLDILAAFVDYRISTGKENVTIILNYIASGIFGKAAYTDGMGYPLLGLLLHYVIAFSFTLLFFWLYAKTSLLSKNWIVTGIVYGIFIWLVMNLVVVQLSNTSHAAISAMKFTKVLKSALILICMIGLPLSFIANKTSKK